MPLDVDALAAAAAAAVPDGLVSVYLFGSHASGRSHRDSDLDVALLLDRRCCVTPESRFEARVALASRLGRFAGRGGLVDVVVLNDAPPHLVRRIMTEGRRLSCRDEAQDFAARRLALSRAADLEPFLRRMRALKLEALAR